MPAIKLDVALIHTSRADRLGNTQTDGPDPFFDGLFARAADKVFVTTEVLVDRIDAEYSTRRNRTCSNVAWSPAWCQHRSARTRPPHMTPMAGIWVTSRTMPFRQAKRAAGSAISTNM
jgi:hypothetical protein